MALQLINHLPDGSQQKIDMKSGSQSIKANSNTMYELKDTSTNKAPKMQMQRKMVKT